MLLWVAPMAYSTPPWTRASPDPTGALQQWRGPGYGAGWFTRSEPLLKILPAHLSGLPAYSLRRQVAERIRHFRGRLVPLEQDAPSKAVTRLAAGAHAVLPVQPWPIPGPGLFALRFHCVLNLRPQVYSPNDTAPMGWVATTPLEPKEGLNGPPKISCRRQESSVLRPSVRQPLGFQVVWASHSIGSTIDAMARVI